MVSDVKELIHNGADSCEIKICNDESSKCVEIRIDDGVKIRGLDKLIEENDYLRV